jgi:hypothetical protein
MTMWSTKLCFEAVDLFVRGYECGDVDREGAIIAALNVASRGGPEVRRYLDDRFFDADRRLAIGRGEDPPVRSEWTLGVADGQLTSLGLRTIAQTARELHRKEGGLRRDIQRLAKELGLTDDPNASFGLGRIRVFRFGGTWLCRVSLNA